MYLDPFDWIINYNLGLVHLKTEQHASAFHYLNTAIALNPGFAHSYMHLGSALSKLKDYENATRAYDKAIELDNEPLFHLNYGEAHLSNAYSKIEDYITRHYITSHYTTLHYITFDYITLQCIQGRTQHLVSGSSRA